MAGIFLMCKIEANNSDPAPSSGTYAFETSLDGTNWNAYTAPLTLADGAYVLQIRVIDNAGNQALNADAINVDTTPPTISGTLVGQLGANNWYISSVQAEVSVSDTTSGIASTKYSADGGAWENYTTPISFESGTHQIQFRTTDTAGLISETETFDFKIDSSAPEIHLPSRWYIWESGTFTIKDTGSKIVSLSYQIRDSQNRWKKIESNWTPSTTNFSHTISWNRVFADGIVAPVGNYHVTVYAKDAAGNTNQKSAQIIIPPPNATALPTFTATPTATNTPTDAPVDRAFIVPSQTPMPTQTPFIFIAPINPATEDDDDDEGGVFSFFSAPKVPITPQEQKSNILWGATAAAALGAFNATIVQRKRREAIAARAAERAKKENKRRELQKIWDANGAAIYEANKTFETDHGHKMDSASREKAIAEATVGGVFNAGLYSVGLTEAQEEKEAERVAAQQALHEKSFNHKESLLELSDLPEEEDKTQFLANWKEGDMAAASAAVEEQKGQDGLMAYYEGRKAGETPDISLAEWKKADFADMARYLDRPDNGWALGKIYRSDWGEASVSQGPLSNDCGVAALATMLNGVTGTTDWNMDKLNVGWRLPDLGQQGNNFVQWGLDKVEISVIYENVIGATHPRGVVNEFNRIARQNDIQFRAERVSDATKDDLLAEIQAGNPVSTIRVWDNNRGAHYQNVVGYDAATDTVYYTDSDSKFSNDTKYPVGEKVQSDNWKEFSADWDRPLNLPWGETLQNEMIIYQPKP